MVWLAVRQTSVPQEAFLEAATNRLAPASAFYQIVANGQPLGNAGITLDTTLTGYRLTEVWAMDLPSASGPTRHVSRSDANLSRSFKLQQQMVTLSEDKSARVIELELKDTAITIAGRRPGSAPETPIVLPANSATIPGALAYRLVAERRLESGASATHPAAVPLFARIENHSVRVRDSAIQPVADSAVWDSVRSEWKPAPAIRRAVWRVDRNWNGMPVIEWVDGQGHLVRRSWAWGLTLERSPFEVNYNQYQAGLRSGAIKLPDQVPGDRARSSFEGAAPDTGITSLRVVLGRTDGPTWPGASAAFAGGRQSVAGDTVTIERTATGPGQVPGAGEYLEATRGVTGFISAVEQAVAQAGPGVDTLTALVRWVRHSVKLGGREAPGHAIGAARSRTASAEGKVRLLVELARLGGMPARPVIGVDVGQPGLPAHAWAEVWRQDRWIAVDPVYGHVPAAASLLRVAEGGNAQPLALVPLVASLRTTILTTSR